MSSSVERRPRRGVLRDGDVGDVEFASVVSPRGTVVNREGSSDDLSFESIEQRIAKAREEGVAQGRASGLAEALLASETERNASLATMSARLADACATAARDRRAVVDEVVSEAVDLAFGLLEVLVGHDLDTSGSPVRHAVKRAVAMAPDGEDIRVRVHPAADISPAELEDLAAVGGVSILPDPAVELTGCVVETGACRIDAQIGPALRRVRAVLEQARSVPSEAVAR